MSRIATLNLMKISYQQHRLFIRLDIASNYEFLYQILYVSFIFIRELKSVVYLLYFYGKKLLYDLQFFFKNSNKIFLSQKALTYLISRAPAAVFFVQINSILVTNPRLMLTSGSGGWLLATAV